jgi:hypothetical protein
MVKAAAFMTLVRPMFLLLLALAGQAAGPLNTWHWRTPLPQGNSLRGAAGTTNLYVVVGEAGTILVSTNTLDWLVVNPPIATNLNAICFAANQFVIVGEGGTILTSANGTNWTRRTSPTTNHLYSAVYANGLFVAVGNAGTLITSPNGNSWTLRNSQLGNNAVFQDITFGNGRFVAIATVFAFDFLTTAIITSVNGTTWTQLAPSFPVLDTITFGNGQFLACGGQFGISNDGLEWSFYYLGSQISADELAFTDGRFVAVNSSRILYSTNATNWVVAGGATAGASLRALGFANGRGIAVGYTGQMLASTNVTNWIAASSGPVNHLESMTYGKGIFVGVGNGVLTSVDGRGWTQQTNTPYALEGVACGAGVFVAVGRGFLGETNMISYDAANWRRLHIPTTNDLYDIVFADGKFVAVGDRGTVCDSVDGTNWNTSFIATATYLRTIAFGNGRFVAGGIGGIYLSDDLQTWTRVASSNVNWYGMAYGNGMFVAAGVTQFGQVAPHVMRSFDGTNWEPSTESREFSDLAFGRGTFVGATGDGVVISTNGLDWLLQTNPPVQFAQVVAFGRETFVVSKYGGGILQSDEIFPLPQLAAPSYAPGQILFSVVSGGTGITYTVQSSSNLNEWADGAVFSAPQFPITITNQTSTPARFYRVVGR